MGYFPGCYFQHNDSSSASIRRMNKFVVWDAGGGGGFVFGGGGGVGGVVCGWMIDKL